MPEYKKPTDEVHEISLASKMTAATWGQRAASVGDTVRLFVQTHFVGNGAAIEIAVQDKSGKKVQTLKGQVFGDQFAESVVIPEKAKEALSFTAKLPKHGLAMDSGKLIVMPKIDVTNLKWGCKEARRGDVVKLSADVLNIADDETVMLMIYEFDQDGAHDFITKFPHKVKNKRIQADWEYEYHEDTDEIPTQDEKSKYGKNYNPPEYFFVVAYHARRFGEKQESGLLGFKDWVKIELTDDDGDPIADEPYIVHLPDGTTRKGQLDSNGTAIERNIAPGKVFVEFPESGADYLLRDVTD